ncbi:MAG: DUF2191 domain-containing protein [Candidatus Hydrogenedentes bacterium]|nr:DUF2191 domain-containing protein [Candidatus Hydrogenedentota bacterium]
MVSHMKTTIQISDALLNRAREVAAKEDTTLKDLVEEALHRLLDERDRRKPFKLRDGSVGGGWLRPEVAELGMDKIIELSYGDRGG